MQMFDKIKQIFPLVTKKQIEKWLEIILIIFTIYVSSMMVGFTISWNSLTGEVIKGEIDKKIVMSGMNANIVITMYYWLGAALIFVSGIKHLWLHKDKDI
jgi:hypothetical protein